MIDWVAVGLSLLGWYLMANQRVTALKVLICANITWIAWCYTQGVASLAFLQCCFIALNIRAILAWRAEQRAAESREATSAGREDRADTGDQQS